jgi:hypothetical protein
LLVQVGQLAAQRGKVEHGFDAVQRRIELLELFGVVVGSHGSRVYGGLPRRLDS